MSIAIGTAVLNQSVTHKSGATGKITQIVRPSAKDAPSTDEVLVIQWTGIATPWAERTATATVS